MKNPLFKSSLFVIPESFEELDQMIKDHYHGKESQAIAYHMSMVTLNLCHKLVEQAIEQEKTTA